MNKKKSLKSTTVTHKLTQRNQDIAPNPTYKIPAPPPKKKDK